MNKEFNYTYAAPTEEERQEVESILEQYSPEERKQTELEKLRRLNNLVNTPPKILAFVLGIIGLLIFGVGLTCVLEWNMLVLGIVAMVVGLAVMIVNKFIFNAYLAKQKKKFGNDIIEICNKLLNK